MVWMQMMTNIVSPLIYFQTVCKVINSRQYLPLAVEELKAHLHLKSMYFVSMVLIDT